ncbi:receptor-like kinase TMK4 [Amaranthus tricolor]|uniref:receptor-like kinase TMK4 n=1 Tax=Amaranthus tricolor TaxID=29722 RepID=UPI0025840D06|nr:receptor-like kinase TMK4 [Amaranthus tricolor]
MPRLLNISLQNNKLQGPFPVFPESVLVSLGTNNLFCKNVPGDCNPQVMTLLKVAGALDYPLKLAEAWQGNNACSKWPFVTCDASGNIIKVNLSKQGFTGTISPAFANLTFLNELYLNDNNLTGTIPETLTTLKRLKQLNVSNNDLSGEVPNFKSSVTVLVAGNKNIGRSNNSTTTPADERHKSLTKTAKILLVTLIPTILMAALWFFVYAYKRKWWLEHDEDAEQWNLHVELDSPLTFKYNNLKMATNNFDDNRKLGGGGFGTVYEGKLDDGTRIAVKRLDHVGQGRKEFLTEVQTIGSIHHVNLVKLVGFCAEKVQRLLVYEYMSKGSLDKWVFNSDSKHALTWVTRRKIILHIAKGLAYLHEDCQKRIAHLDVKPQNVLLDEEYNAKLSDFGLAKLIDRDQSHVMTQMRGTRGYLAPEFLGRKIMEKVDVYSYGVLVMEVVFGRKNLDYSRPDESKTLIQMVKMNVEANEFSGLLDECGEDVQQYAEEIKKTLILGVSCLHSEPEKRPSMSTVVKVLEGASISEAVNQYSLTVMTVDGTLTNEDATQLSPSILSGPR